MENSATLLKSRSDMICPVCCTFFGFDGKSCSHCGMTITGFTKTHFQISFSGPGSKAIGFGDKTVPRPNIDYFLKPPKLYDPSDILGDKKLVPAERGLYGWYFDTVPKKLPQGLKYITVDGMLLLYIGMAGGVLKLKGNLRQRIVEFHLNGNYKGSTVAHSLHAVLDIPKENKGERKEWMKRHMKVAWMENPNPKPTETEIINKYGHILPFNIDENEERNPFAAELTKLRDNL